MDWLALVLAGVAAVLGFRALSLAKEARHASEVGPRAASEQLARLEKYVKRMADGVPVTSDMIEEDRLYAEIDAAAARVLVEDEREDVVIVDVRSAPEFESGHIDGALWIPVEEIERRADEVPRRGRVLVFCAVGGRSAAACHLLSEKGFTNLTNVDGGMMAWQQAERDRA
jgi:rhodanese-related sulfurtransferase